MLRHVSTSNRFRADESLSERAYQSIRDKILRGQYPLGAALSSAESSRDLPRRRTLASLAHNLFESLAEGRHRRAVFKARQIAHLPFINLVEFAHPASATGAHQPPVPCLPTHPQFQSLGLFVDLVPINPVARPAQDPGPIAVSQTAECSRKTLRAESPSVWEPVRFLRRAESWLPCEHCYSRNTRHSS